MAKLYIIVSFAITLGIALLLLVSAGKSITCMIHIPTIFLAFFMFIVAVVKFISMLRLHEAFDDKAWEGSEESFIKEERTRILAIDVILAVVSIVVGVFFFSNFGQCAFTVTT